MLTEFQRIFLDLEFKAVKLLENDITIGLQSLIMSVQTRIRLFPSEVDYGHYINSFLEHHTVELKNRSRNLDITG
jgi:hypothetical protein